ncbi:RES family NAD+ phosphorylase [Xanthomonas axonopodis pv. nakataecorchori]|uniref:RES family NAD+ phosphorylase n=1 Tax=Xanthomonas axonopodis TaxID=53413 RepID=UPI0035311E34
MPRRSQQPVPLHGVPNDFPASIQILDRFSESDLEVWKKRSRELDAVHDELYHGLEPERARRRQQLVDALNARPAPAFDFKNWVRMVQYRYSHDPLSAAGSVLSVGGRFSIGNDCDESGAAVVFPALYIGDSHETAFRECYQMPSEKMQATGLTPAEMSLRQSDASVRMHGHIERVFDIRNLDNLKPIAKVLATFTVPPELAKLARSLKLGKPEELLIKTPSRLQTNLQDINWRGWPTQFGLPSPSQRFGLLLKWAGYEGVLYRSSKQPGSTCIAIFPSNLCSDRTFVELADGHPPNVTQSRLDISTAHSLCGWEHVRRADRAP